MCESVQLSDFSDISDLPHECYRFSGGSNIVRCTHILNCSFHIKLWHATSCWSQVAYCGNPVEERICNLTRKRNKDMSMFYRFCGPDLATFF